MSDRKRKNNIIRKGIPINNITIHQLCIFDAGGSGELLCVAIFLYFENLKIRYAGNAIAKKEKPTLTKCPGLYQLPFL